LKTGTYNKNELNFENFADETYQSFQFTGLINYLIFLEQLGSILKPKYKCRIDNGNGIYCCLKYYSGLSDNKINALKSLRNSLTHKFGLATEQGSIKIPPRKFILSIGENPDIVELPKVEWDGNFTAKLDQSSTTIHITDLIKLIEKIYQQILEDNNSNKLDILLEIPELESRFTIVN